MAYGRHWSPRSPSPSRSPDANINRFLKTCDITEELTERIARRAGELRSLAGQGSAVDAIVVALVEPGGAVLSSDLKGLRALASHADAVQIYSA
ncbi:MAG: hypothetical protein GXP35_13070 [Actinobacteria bacterium]|nr:hypothetical protein [Actinomycetota bacterium]